MILMAIVMIMAMTIILENDSGDDNDDGLIIVDLD